MCMLLVYILLYYILLGYILLCKDKKRKLAEQPQTENIRNLANVCIFTNKEEGFFLSG